MEYRPLALKYRPRRFEQVIGQDAAVATLRGMVRTNKVPNLIILSGSTGVGKTTLSRILGRYVNCEAKGGVDECDGCSSCKLFNKDRHPDIHEVDGGTFTGIDDVRNMQRVVGLHSRFTRTVRIFDECHSLSKPAWVACLKTFEQPPPGVTFILCTTDLPKVPPAIQGRAIIINLSTLAESTLIKWLRRVAKHEGTEISKEVAAKLAYYSQGHPRNALNALERVLLALQSGDKIDIEKESAKVVETTLGLTPWLVIDRYVAALLCGHTHNALKLAGAIQSRKKNDAEDGKLEEEKVMLNSYYFVQQVCESIRVHLCSVVAPKLVTGRFTRAVRENGKYLREWSPEKLIALLDLYVRAYERIKTYVVPEQETLALVTLQALELRGFNQQ